MRRALGLVTSTMVLSLLVGGWTCGAAQEVSVGARGGLSAGYTLFENEVDSQREVRPFPLAGAVLSISLRSWMALQVEALYVEKGWSDSGHVGGLRMGYVEVPLLLRVHGDGTLLPHLLVGPSFGYQVSCSFGEVTEVGDVGCDHPLVSLRRSSWDAGVAMGLGIGWHLRGGTLSVDALVNVGLHDVIREPLPWGAQTNVGLSLSVAYTVDLEGSGGTR